MTWRIEASGGTGSANLLVIRPCEDDEPGAEIRHAILTVSPKGGRECPTLPLFPVGYVYRSRVGMAFRILECAVVETGPDDGEHSMWGYEYLTSYSAVLPVGAPS